MRSEGKKKMRETVMREEEVKQMSEEEAVGKTSGADDRQKTSGGGDRGKTSGGNALKTSGADERSKTSGGSDRGKTSGGKSSGEKTSDDERIKHHKRNITAISWVGGGHMARRAARPECAPGGLRRGPTPRSDQNRSDRS